MKQGNTALYTTHGDRRSKDPEALTTVAVPTGVCYGSPGAVSGTHHRARSHFHHCVPPLGLWHPQGLCLPRASEVGVLSFHSARQVQIVTMS